MEIKTLENIPAKIEFNYDDILKSLTEYSEKYVGLIVTEENLKEMTGVKAELVKVETFIENYRKTQKKEMEAPIKAFELKCKTLLEVVKKVSEPIKLQLDEFEEKRKAEKEKEIQEVIKKVADELGLNEKYAEQLTVIPKYLNKTQKDSDTLEDLKNRGKIILGAQQQEEQLEKMKAEKLNFIQGELEKVNAKYGTELKISDFTWLVDKDITEISKNITARANYLYQEKLAKENAEAKKVMEAEAPKEQPKKSGSYNFILKISDCSLEQAKLLKKFLVENNIIHALEQK